MKRLFITLSMLFLGACASTGNVQLDTHSAQVAYVQACSAYGSAFNAALQLRKDGKLNQAQIDQVTLLDSQITPICTGPLPANPAAATQQITAAVTTLGIMEAAHQLQGAKK